MGILGVFLGALSAGSLGWMSIMAYSQDWQLLLDHLVYWSNLCSSCDKRTGTINLKEDKLLMDHRCSNFSLQSTGSMVFRSVASQKHDGGKAWQKKALHLPVDSKQRRFFFHPCRSHFLTHWPGTEPSTHELLVTFYTQT